MNRDRDLQFLREFEWRTIKRCLSIRQKLQPEGKKFHLVFTIYSDRAASYCAFLNPGSEDILRVYDPDGGIPPNLLAAGAGYAEKRFQVPPDKLNALLQLETEFTPNINRHRGNRLGASKELFVEFKRIRKYSLIDLYEEQSYEASPYSSKLHTLIHDLLQEYLPELPLINRILQSSIRKMPTPFLAQRLEPELDSTIAFLYAHCPAANLVTAINALGDVRAERIHLLASNIDTALPDGPELFREIERSLEKSFHWPQDIPM